MQRKAVTFFLRHVASNGFTVILHATDFTMIGEVNNDMPLNKPLS